jgi:hypothetical protein
MMVRWDRVSWKRLCRTVEILEYNESLSQLVSDFGCVANTILRLAHSYSIAEKNKY